MSSLYNKFFSAEKARSGMIHFRSSFLHQSNYFDVLLSEPRISSLGFEPNHIFHICVLPRWTSELPLNPEIPYDSIPENRAYDSRPKEDWNLMGLAAMAGRSLFLQQVLDLPLPYRKLDLIYRASQRELQAKIFLSTPIGLASQISLAHSQEWYNGNRRNTTITGSG